MASFGVALVLLLCFVVPSMATVYTVGDSMGWKMNINYDQWVGRKIFVLGDSLVFNYEPGHTVNEVTMDDYATCKVGNAIATYNSGNTTIPLTTPGLRFFICAVPGHCSSGMRLVVEVVDPVTIAPPPPRPDAMSPSLPPSSGATSLMPISDKTAQSPSSPQNPVPISSVTAQSPSSPQDPDTMPFSGDTAQSRPDDDPEFPDDTDSSSSRILSLWSVVTVFIAWLSLL